MKNSFIKNSNAIQGILRLFWAKNTKKSDIALIYDTIEYILARLVVIIIKIILIHWDNKFR